MRRPLSLRQVEAFKAVIEHGSISRAASVLHVSQPAMSKMIAALEHDAALVLFDRLKGRLAPTQRGMRLYDEVDRIFTGLRQVENAVAAIHREDQERLAVGVMPALSGGFVERVTSRFLQRHPQAFCSVECRSSQRIAEWLVARRVDVGLVSADVDNPYLVSEPMMERRLVCIMPPGHALAARRQIRAADLDRVPFVSFDPESPSARRIAAMFAAQRSRLDVALVANLSQTLCAFVAAGHGVSLVHPLYAEGFGERIVVRPFASAITLDFRISRSRESRNARLVDDFIAVTREIAGEFMHRRRSQR